MWKNFLTKKDAEELLYLYLDPVYIKHFKKNVELYGATETGIFDELDKAFCVTQLICNILHKCLTDEEFGCGCTSCKIRVIEKSEREILKNETSMRRRATQRKKI